MQRYVQSKNLAQLQIVSDLRAEAEGLEAEYGPNAYSQFLRRNGRRPDPSTAAAIGLLLGGRVKADDGSMQPKPCKKK